MSELYIDDLDRRDPRTKKYFDKQRARHVKEIIETINNANYLIRGMRFTQDEWEDITVACDELHDTLSVAK